MTLGSRHHKIKITSLTKDCQQFFVLFDTYCRIIFQTDGSPIQIDRRINFRNEFYLVNRQTAALIASAVSCGFSRGKRCEP
jgi:hypothetical protein